MVADSLEETVSIRANTLNRCPECDSTDIQHEPNGESFCMDCGLVINDFIAESTFDDERMIETQRMGCYQDNIQTYVGNAEDINSHEHHKLKKSNRTIRYQDIDYTFVNGIVNIEQIVSFLSLPENIKDEATLLFKNLQEKGFCQGKTIQETVAGSIYWSCRQFKIPRTKEEISQHIDITKNRINSIYKEICRETETGHLPFTPSDYLNRYLSQLQLNGSKRKKCKQIIDNLNQTFIGGKNPRSIVGAVIRHIYKEELSLKEISETVNISTDNIRKNEEKIFDNMAS